MRIVNRGWHLEKLKTITNYVIIKQIKQTFNHFVETGSNNQQNAIPG